jgi:hypothetical protein
MYIFNHYDLIISSQQKQKNSEVQGSDSPAWNPWDSSQRGATRRIVAVAASKWRPAGSHGWVLPKAWAYNIGICIWISLLVVSGLSTFKSYNYTRYIQH